MRTLILVRHAKSSWDNLLLADFDRPLNRRGKRDAPDMAQFLKQSAIIPQCIITSPAKRARKTAGVFAGVLLDDESRVDLRPAVYDASAEKLLGVVNHIADDVSSCMLVGHNPGLTDLANLLLSSRSEHVDNIPTTGVVVLQLYIDSWAQASASVAKLSRFIYPGLIHSVE